MLMECIRKMDKCNHGYVTRYYCFDDWNRIDYGSHWVAEVCEYCGEKLRRFGFD